MKEKGLKQKRRKKETKYERKEERKKFETDKKQIVCNIIQINPMIREITI